MSVKALTAQIRILCDQIDAEVTPPPLPPTTHCYFGYYGDTYSIVAETKDHADLTWVYGWGWPNPPGNGTPQAQVESCKLAVAAGNEIMLGVYGEGDQAGLEWFLELCRLAGVLESVVALYPIDEPDVQGKSDAWVTNMVTWVKAAAAKFPVIANVPIAVIYGVKGTPGIMAYDWIGRDKYGSGPQPLPLTGKQRLMIVPGGSFGERPDSYVTYATTHPEVVAVVAFDWPGIKGGSLEGNYRTAGHVLTGRP